MATVTVSAASLDPLGAAVGVQFEPYPINVASQQLAPATQTVYGVAVYAGTGAVVTGIKMRNAIAAAGTTPTTARLGLADLTGKLLALTGNVNAAASWPTGVCTFPFTAPITLLYSGVYLPCVVINGAWGTTQPTPTLINTNSALAQGADGTNPPLTFSVGAQTDLPAVGASLAITAPSNRAYYLALY